MQRAGHVNRKTCTGAWVRVWTVQCVLAYKVVGETQASGDVAVSWLSHALLRPSLVLKRS